MPYRGKRLMLQIDWPWVFLLLPLPLAVYFGMPTQEAGKEAALRVPFIEDFNFAQQPQQRRLKLRWLKWLSLLAWLLVVLAASRPQWLGDTISINISGRDLMIAVDLSDTPGLAWPLPRWSRSDAPRWGRRCSRARALERARARHRRT